MNEEQRQYYLKTMGIPVWLTCQQDEYEDVSTEVENIATEDKLLSWESLQKEVANCKQCLLHQSRTQTVFGVGCQTADLLIVGEAPGFHEDQQGEPFVGRAGQLLNDMLLSIGLSRQKVYIANVLKCRPPNNRDPSPEEVATCTPFLEKQISLLKPKLILAVGRVAAHYLLKSNAPMRELRGQIFHFGEQTTPLVVTYHPAYLLRSPREKRKAFEDLLKIQGMLAS